MFAASKTDGATTAANYVEEVFSTYLYTGNGSTQTITNGIDLSTYGGLVWTKSRSNATSSELRDTLRGATKSLRPDSTAAEVTDTGNALTAFNSNGFSLGADTWFTTTNVNGRTYTSWTFREQAKFFDVVTYTGNGSNRTISHNLGSVPGCIIVKNISNAVSWRVYHRSLGNTKYLTLDTTAAEDTASSLWNNTTPTSTEFTVGTASSTNANGDTFVAYLFAHDAGGFGLTGSDNVISCGSISHTGGSDTTVNVGYEPQWLMVKRTDNTSNWFLLDNMRGLTTGGDDARLFADTSGAESTSNNFDLTSTGFIQKGVFDTGTYIYIAIRRGPMKVPTSGTSVFTPVARSGTGSTATVSNGITTDLIISMVRNTGGIPSGVWDRLRGFPAYLETTGTASESTSSDSVTAMNNTAYVLGADSGTDRINRSGYTYANWTFGRAPGFFDVVCYTGNGTAGTTISHNLTVAPEMMIVKARNYTGGRPWPVYHIGIGNTKFMYLNTTDAEATNTWWNDTTPTASVFTVGSNSVVNFSGTNYVAYLFATVAGVSKVGSYTGTGTTQTINCGFTAGSRFVMIKRTDSTGDWYVWDTARGIVAGNDPYLLLNSTAAEVTNTDYVDTSNAGFEISSTAPAAINANGGTFIFLAIS